MLSGRSELRVSPSYYDLYALFGIGLTGRLPDTGQLGQEMRKIKGMILKQVVTMPMVNRPTFTEVATAVETGPIPRSTFEVPAGYQRKAAKN